MEPLNEIAAWIADLDGCWSVLSLCKQSCGHQLIIETAVGDHAAFTVKCVRLTALKDSAKLDDGREFRRVQAHCQNRNHGAIAIAHRSRDKHRVLDHHRA